MVWGVLALRPECRPKPESRRKRLWRGRGDGAEANSVRLRGQRVESHTRCLRATTIPPTPRSCPTLRVNAKSIAKLKSADPRPANDPAATHGVDKLTVDGRLANIG